MDRKTYYPNSLDADVEAPPSYGDTTTQLNANYRSEQSANSSTTCEPSAPPSEVSYSYQQPLNTQQPTNYQTIPIPQQPLYVMRYIIKNKNGNDRHFPINATIFVLGFLCPPVWFIGCCWTSTNRYEIAWRKLNIFMTIICVLIVILFTIMMTILMLEEQENAPHRPSTGDLPKLPPF